MRNCFYSKTKEEIRRKLTELYSEPLASYRNVLDFDRAYDFFSEDESHMIKYSSKWFNPEKYDQQDKPKQSDETPYSNQMFKVCQDDIGNYYKNTARGESAWKLERLGSSGNQLTRDLEKLGRTPYHIGMEGEKFRVVAATLQKCNPPFVRRTFQFTSNGIIETPEAREEAGSDQMKIFPIINQTKKGVTQKLVTIRRFRVIKKDGFPGEKSLVPQKLKMGNGEKPRFLTVRIRSKERHSEETSKKSNGNPAPEVIRLTSSTEEEDFDYGEKTRSPTGQTEETDEGEEPVTETAIEETGTVTEQERKTEEKKVDKEEVDSNDTDEASFENEDCSKRFSSYQSCFARVRAQQRQSCQFCSKRFLTSKLLREHVRTHHPHQRCGRSGGASEDRIKTATSKFGRTRRVLNIAGLRSKYKML